VLIATPRQLPDGAFEAVQVAASQTKPNNPIRTRRERIMDDRFDFVALDERTETVPEKKWVNAY
jgi:hypothetical protein